MCQQTLCRIYQHKHATCENVAQTNNFFIHCTFLAVIQLGSRKRQKSLHLYFCTKLRQIQKHIFQLSAAMIFAPSYHKFSTVGILK